MRMKIAVVLSYLMATLSVLADGGWATIHKGYFQPLGGFDDNTSAHTALHGDLPIHDGVSGPLSLTNDVNATHSIYVSGCAKLNDGEATIGSNQYDAGTGMTGTEIPPGATRTFDLPYQTKGQPIDRVYFTVEYWDPNKKDNPMLSGVYKGTFTSSGASGSSFSDSHLQLVVLPAEGKSIIAFITYSDSAGTYQEQCSLKVDDDGTFTLQGLSCNAIMGSHKFSLDTFILKYNDDGTIAGSSTDSAGNSSTLALIK